jgi:hypothetical protein
MLDRPTDRAASTIEETMNAILQDVYRPAARQISNLPRSRNPRSGTTRSGETGRRG